MLKRFVNDRLLVSNKNDQDERILSVAHEALFRVWDTLNGWLRQDRKALALRARIEDAAAEWQAENRAENRAWPEERILDAVREIEKSGVSLDDVEDRATVDAFLGPTDPEEIARLPALDPAEASGRYGDAWRLPLGHEARASAGVRLALLGDMRRGVGLREGNHPVDYVNWQEAVVFCDWLSTRIGRKVRLPTEFEWQLAATGGDPKRIYPWGSNWNPHLEQWRANTGEADLFRSTAVGLYPQGSSPAGVQDMVGTIYEWCLNNFHNPEDNPDDIRVENKSTDRRVLRGGSWRDNHIFACSTHRTRNYPLNRSNVVGFRVLCSSISVDQ